MKNCPKCNESNGEHATSCYKCGASFGPVATYKKLCPKCKQIYSGTTTTCPTCHTTLSVYSDDNSSYDSGEKWPYVIGILFPLIGIILGLIYITQQKDNGSTVLITSIVASVVWTIISVATFF